MIRFGTNVLVIAVLAFVTRGARADVRLAWRAPAPCVTGAEAEARLAELLAGSAAAGTRTLEASVRVEGEGTRWRLDLATNLDGVRGQRTIDGESCEAVTSAALVILAITLDPGLRERATGPVVVPPPPPPPRPVKPPAPPAPKRVPEPPPARAATPPEPAQPPPAPWPPAPPPTPDPPRRTPWSFQLAGAAGVAEGLLPALSPVASLGVGVSRSSLTRFASFEGSFRAAWPQETGGLEAAPWVDVALRAFEVAAGPCATTPTNPRVQLRLCGAVGAQRLSGRARAVSDPTTGAAWLLSLGARVVGAVSVSDRAAVLLELGGTLRPGQPPFVVEPFGAAWTPDRRVLHASIGLEWRSAR